MAETQAATRLREYETIFLVKPDLTDDNVDKLKERVRGIVGRDGGKLLRFTVWGKKKTLFPVAKQPRAIYVHASYLGGAKLVAEVERNLRNLDEVTRYISVKIADEVDPETRPVLEDLKLAGDVEETRPGAPAEREGGFRGGEEPGVEAEEESTEEA
ncbi:30S ribosomal protein S6 [Pyxidicoccus caerfyrddinensis]|jgi:small subunit ribosomal protein S6|uniref:30S ribosomal protein S6 n=1 Tax=Pyxidicoccus caerfyrddinensis TaxID=2709663 RepID=UPI0013D94CE5|nr:30S ribosomal protein S6 [Pyxidicoccus caerfyrddinensis]